MQAIGIDLGGTRIKGVLINSNGDILQELITGTLAYDQQWKKDVKEIYMSLSKYTTEKYVVGLSAPGIPNDQNTAIAFLPNRLDGIEGFIWTDALEADTYVVNDAIAALSAEASFGAAQNCENAVLITIGTGVGGAILINKKIYQGAFQKAGHIGHMSVDMEGDPDICGMPGSLEEAIGNYSVAKRSNGKFNDTLELIQAMKNNDPIAIEIWHKSVKALAISISSISNIISPEKIVLAGGITKAGDALMSPLRTFMDQFEWRPGGKQVKIDLATFSDKAGAIGAAAFALEKTK
ncbi:MAG: ROK family protein [Bacteroidota bacterium]|jgi:glucokinase|nr:glucokinase [Bacteroidota bacterium]